MPEKQPSYSNPDPSAVAIVGLSISAPGGEARGLDTQAFYEFLQRRGSGIITVPKDRWNADAFYGKGPGKICTTKGAFIPEFAAGDPQEFGITPAEAAQLAVTQVASLHQAFNALQRSGIDYRGTNTGVFVGCAGGGPPMEMDITQAGAYYMTGSSLSITANRISYVFDLLGQSLPVDTACSSSLTAMHLAVQAIRRGEIDQAVVAGVNVILTPLETASFSQLGVMSPDGISKSFDDEANGYARGDVASAVVIKRHDLAVKDYDRVYATLVGSALTSCGSIMGSLTTPSPEAQTAAIRNAYHDAGLEPYQADFVELHGAGTVVGDALEAYAAGALFSQNRDGREILMGSVKSNVGHGEMGAYMSSLIKVVMMLDRKQVLPNGHFSKPSTRIEFEKYNLRVPTSVEDFVPHNPELGLIASISSYGFGGSCGHTVLRAHEHRPTHFDNHSLEQGPFLFAIGALTPKSVHTLIERYKEDYATANPLALSEHLAIRARQMPWRTFAVGHSLQNASFPDPVMVGKRPYPVILCFSGQGPQHWDQGRNLMRTYSVFRESIEACDAVHEAYTGRSCLKETGLFASDAPKESVLKSNMSWPADIISVAITFFQIAMFDLLISLGLKPDAVVGHSIGETAVLYASGAMPRDMVVKIAIARGRALSKVDNTGGTMVAISGCDESSIRDHIAAVSFLGTQTGMPVADLHLAAFNSPTDIGVSGPEAQVDLLRTYIETWVDGVAARKLRVSTAVHSPFVEPCQETYRAELETIFDHYASAGAGPFVPKVPTMSTVTAEFRDGKEYTIDYLWQNLRQPVLFCRAIENLVEKYGQYTAFVEISPHPVLSQSIKKMGALDSLPTSSRPPSARQLKAGARLISEHETLLRALGQLVLYGINSINFSVLNGCPAEYIEGPPYPFQWKVTPFALPVPSYLNRLLPRTRPLNSTRLRVSPQLPEPWISHHVIDHSNLIPAATYIEMALEFPGVTQLWDCHFEAACILEESVPAVTLEVAKDGINWQVKSSTALQSVEGDLEWTRTGAVFDKTHAYGKVGYGKPQLDSSSSITRVDVEAVLARCLQTNYKEEMYADMEGFAQFGDEFKRLNKACMNETEAICWIRGHVEGVNTTDYQFHPALMDAVFQTAITWNMLYDKINVGDKDRSFLLPHSLRRAYRNDGNYEPLVLPEEFITYTILQECSPRHWIIDAYVLDDTGAVLFTFEGLYFKLVDQNEQWPQQRYTMHWQPRALPQTQLEGHEILDGPSKTTVELMALLDQLALAYTHECLSTLPSDLEVDSPDRKRYLSWARAQVERHSRTSLPEIPASVRQEYNSLIELTERVGHKQRDIIGSSAVAIELLFHDDLMNKVYEQPPFTGSLFERFVDQFVDLVKHGAKSGKRVIRVLEVGAGTGRLTVMLSQALIDAKMDELCFVDYVTTDVATYLAQQSAARSPWPTVTSMAFDLTSPTEEQGLQAGSFDIIVGFDVLHAIPNVQSTLGKLSELLLPGGHIAILELDGRCFSNGAAGSIWMDFIFGSFAEWMGVLDERASAKHCSLTPDDWKTELQRAGFSDTLIVSSSTEAISHIAFVSQASPSSTPSSPASSTSSSKPLTPPQTYLDPHIRAVSPDASSEPNDCDSVDDKPLDGLVLPSIQPADSTLGLTSPIPTSGLIDDRTIVHHFTAGGEVELVRLLAGLDTNVPYVVWLHADADPSACALLGIARTIRHEFGLWRIMFVQFDPSWNSQRQQSFVRTKLVPLKWIDPEILVDAQGEMFVPRVVPAPLTPQVESLSGHPAGFNKHEIWRAYPPSLGPQDVEIKVAYIAATPAFPDCCQFSGEVIGTGSQIQNSTMLGRKVFGVAPIKDSSVVVCKLDQVAAIPSGVDESTAASLAGPLAFISSVVSRAISTVRTKKPRVLLHLGQLSPAASATLSYLSALALDITATVSDPAPSYFKRLPANIHMFQSTPCDLWSFHVRKWASNGVDIALNFDVDQSITTETIQLLSTRGTLVQVGCELPSQLQRGCHYISVDYRDALNEEGLMQSALDNVPSSIWTHLTLSSMVFPLSKRSEAYEQSASAMSEGRAVLLDLRTIESDLPVTRGGLIRGTGAFDPRASYVVIGGVGGLGANIARCLVENGARHVILTSRSGEDAFKPGKLIREKKIITYLRDTPGVTIDILAIDCLDTEKTSALFTQTQRRIAGVFYVAVQLNDQLFVNLKSEQDWKAVSDVKVEGLKVLLKAVNPSDLDFLVLTSSMATVTGSPGQANYAAAQTEMEAMGALLPNTISVTVPPISDGGVFVRSMPTGNARNAALDKYKALGMTGLRVAQHCVDAIWSLSSSSKYSVYIPPTDWKKVIELGSPEYSFSLRHLVSKETQEGGGAAATNERSIRAACAIVLSLDVKDVEENIPLASYGLDSLTSVRLSGILKQYFDITVTQLQLLSRHMTVERLQTMQEEQRLATSDSQESSDAVDQPSADQSTADDTDKTVVRLNTATEGTPLFIFHGAGGGILVLRKMAEKLNFPVFGVQDTQDAPITGTLERLAEFYLSKIVEKQPNGPYRLGGFSFGTCLALVTARMLRDAGESVEAIVMLEGAPTVYQRPKFVASTTAKILDGTLRDEILSLIKDMVSSGAIDDANDVTHQFSTHFEQVQVGSSGARWVARFCKAYVAHILMGLRASEELAQRRKEGVLKDFVWPSARTILVRADDGIGAQAAAEGSSRFLDLDTLTSNIEMRELPGTHFGILSPNAGLAVVLNGLL